MDVVDDPDSKINPDYDFSFSLLEGKNPEDQRDVKEFISI